MKGLSPQKNAAGANNPSNFFFSGGSDFLDRVGFFDPLLRATFYAPHVVRNDLDLNSLEVCCDLSKFRMVILRYMYYIQK